MLALKTPNVLFSLDIDGKAQLALPKDVQRHPIKRHLEHIDLLIVQKGETVTVEVPVTTVGEIAPGGLLETVVTALPVEAEATALPEKIEIDVTGLEPGHSVHAKDITLPAGTVLAGDPDAVVLHILTPSAPEPTAEEAAADA
jgi:large subunit ribosomal protein L25